jgi:hypothetical protein
MADLENPAGRLHALLSEFGSKSNLSIAHAWGEVLDVLPDEVYLQLGNVGNLLAETRRAARDTGSAHWEAMDGHLSALAQCVFPLGIPFANPVADLRPDGTAMQMLGALSFALQLASREGQIPDTGELEELRSSVRDLLAEVAAAEIPAEIRRVLLDRLNQTLEALDHLNVGGPNAVRKAAEALAISATLYEDDSEDARPVFQRIKQAAKATWIAFTVTTQLASAVLTWDKIVDIPAIGPGTEQRQLTPGQQPAEGGELKADSLVQ